MAVIEDVYGARRAGEVMQDTWGHLRPDNGRHDGYVLAAFSAYGGERMLIDADFGDVPDSPWLYEAILDLVDAAPMEEGTVCRFTGACVAVGQRLRFDGEWTRIQVAHDPGVTA